MRVKAVADDCSKLTYTWICDGEVVREVTAAELKAQGLPETSDELRIVGEKECRYQVRVSDGYSEDPIIRNLDVEIDNDFTAYPAGAHIRASGTADESRTIYAAYGETLTLKTCASAYDAEHITYEWYGQNGYSPMGEYGDSIQVTVTRACTYRCRVKDSYDHNKDAYFYIKLAEGFKAWPEGAGIDEYGQRAKEITISTMRGQKSETLLPDGTRIWLNSGTSISYPADYGMESRQVTLNEGEAYLEVARSETLPFRLITIIRAMNIARILFVICFAFINLYLRIDLI